MSELTNEQSPIILKRNEAVAVAKQHGLPDDPKSILYALVIFGVGDSEKSFQSLQKSAGWSRDEYEEAVRLAKQLQNLGVGVVRSAVLEPEGPPELSHEAEASGEPPQQGPAIPVDSMRIGVEALTSPKRRRITSQLDKSFEADDGMAEEWLSGKSPNARRFRNMLRLSLQIDQRSVTGLLMISPTQGGAGLTIEQAKMLGVGLGYAIVEKDSRLTRHDSTDPIVFDEYVEFLGEAGTKYTRDYYDALNKLIKFARNRQRQ